MTSHEFVQPATKLCQFFTYFHNLTRVWGGNTGTFQGLDFDETTIHYFHFS